MPAIVKLQLSLETLAEAISSLDLTEKRQLQELIEQQIFAAEEALYEDDAETQAEIQAVRAEYKDGESVTMLLQLMKSKQEQPFYKTATALEWITAFREWAESHRQDTPLLSDYALSRGGIYDDDEDEHI